MSAVSERAEEVFLAAIERPEEERSAFVAAECAEDDELRRSVLSLLQLHGESGPFDRLYDDFTRRRSDLLKRATDPDEMTEEFENRSSVELGGALGRYEIVERLGEGGMGEVFRAVDPRLGREVAIKVIGRRVEGRQQMLDRFQQEARAASALNHPNIITVHDIDEQDGYPYIVMELVDGESLAARREQRPCDEILHIGRQLTASLSTAHEHGVIHRDLKPENVMVDRQGRARILDFGVAQFRPAPGDDLAVGETVEMPDAVTEPGMVVGTPGYLAPECLRGEPADHRSDQFALGAILYEMATGERAFVGESFVEGVAATLRHEPTPISALRSGLPSELVAIIDRCLSKDPDGRYASTAELHQAFERVTEPGAASAPAETELPAPSGPLYGREETVEELERLLVDDDIRLVTLTGTAGSGKTRLAIEVARRLRSEGAFPGGVVFVSLASIDEPELLVPSIASAVGGVEASAGVELSTLLTRMSDANGAILLVLDNFEQVVEAAPRVAELLAGSPHLTVMATSRELLRLSAEHDYPVEPLRLPPRGKSFPLARLAEIPAVAMFVGRAEAAAPDFELTDENARHVVEICRRLDGLPLALELAAARVRVFPPSALLSRLQSRFRLLTGGARDVPDRQRTLQAAIDWSHELLDDDEKALFRRLGVFVDGFTFEAAEAVADPFGKLATPVIDGVESLFDQSLLARRGPGDEEPRFTMLETVREYALTRLVDCEEEPATRQAHAAYMLVLAEEVGSLDTGDDGAPRLDRFERERGNFRAALDWLVREDRADWGLRLAQGMFHFWDRGNDISEGRRRLDELLALPSAQEESPARARALFSAGVLAADQGDPEAGIERHEECLEIYRRLDDTNGQAIALNAVGIQYTDLGRYEEARECYEECLELWEEVGASDGTARTLSNFAFVLRNQGELGRARQLYRRAATMFERLGDPVGAAWEVSHEADVATDQDDPEAEDLYRQALAAFRELEDSWGVASVLVDLGTIVRADGESDEAEAKFREALEIFAGLRHKRGIARALEGLAAIAATRRDHESVLLLAAAADALRDQVGISLPRRALESASTGREALRSAVTTARERLDPVESDTLWRQGQELSLADLLRRVLHAA